ncbi:hypothetical protein CISIN_1g0022852mg, partial [Citrus sinensis]
MNVNSFEEDLCVLPNNP